VSADEYMPEGGLTWADEHESDQEAEESLQRSGRAKQALGSLGGLTDAEAAAERRARPPARTFNEALLHVYWTSHTDKDGGRSGHLTMRGKVSIDLALEASPEFTPAEMEQIAFAAKMQAAKCLRARRRKTTK